MRNNHINPLIMKVYMIVPHRELHGSNLKVVPSTVPNSGGRTMHFFLAEHSVPRLIATFYSDMKTITFSPYYLLYWLHWALHYSLLILGDYTFHMGPVPVL